MLFVCPALLLFAGGSLATAVLAYILCCVLVVISFIDIDYYIIPNVITYPAVVIGLVLALLNTYFSFLAFPFVPGIQEAGLGLLVGAGVLLFISEVYLRLRRKHGLGMGDVKLLAVTGVFFGFEGAVYTIFWVSYWLVLRDRLDAGWSRRNVEVSSVWPVPRASKPSLYFYWSDFFNRIYGFYPFYDLRNVRCYCNG